MLTARRQEWGLPPGPVRPLAINDLAPDVPVDGPGPDDLVEEIRELHRRQGTG